MARKTEKGGKLRNVLFRTWNMARKLKIMENEKNPLDDLKNDEISEKQMHTFGREIWRGKLKKLDNLERYTLGHGIWQEN
ncbi:hypothetical protein T09_13608 [Trichinella sp. T9]|nr:hypothetical protein T09_13608 [Trichinella sp. T9]